MGGSAIGADLVKGIWSDRLSVPVEVVRSYDLPAWVDGETLVIASSKSGGTEETISALQAALERRCPIVAVTTGGPLRAVAERARLPLATFRPTGRPARRVGYSMGTPAGILERAGLPLDARRSRPAYRCPRWVPLRAASADLEQPAKQLAWALVTVTPSSPPVVPAPVARRWKAQLNENSKATAASRAARGDPQHGRRVRAAGSLRDHSRRLPVEHAGPSANALRAKLIRESS
jgi:glucose/mannose-6-phosphate isomerase